MSSNDISGAHQKGDKAEGKAPDLRNVAGLAEAGYAIFHDIPLFHPEENSPISEEGLPHRARIITGMNPSLSCSSFEEGSLATASFSGSVHLLAASGEVNGFYTCDSGSKVNKETGTRHADRRAPPDSEEIAKALQLGRETKQTYGLTGGYNEVVIDHFAPAGVLVNFDKIISTEMAKIDVLSDSRAQDTNKMTELERVEAVLGGNVSLTDTYGNTPLSQSKNWVEIARSAACAFEAAQESANLTSDTKLPIYALVHGKLHEFKGMAQGYDDCTEISKKISRNPDDDHSARRISWLKAIEGNKPLMESVAGEGKSLLKRLEPLFNIAAEPVSLKEALTKTPEISREEKAALTCGTMHCFKSEYKDIPINKFLELAPEGDAQRKAIAAAEKLPLLRDTKPSRESNAAYVHSRRYNVMNDTFHNISVYGNHLADRARAMTDVRHMNGPSHQLMTEGNAVSERIVPTNIYAYGEGAQTGLTVHEAKASVSEAGFVGAYKEDPVPQKMFEMVQERIQKYGAEGVVYVDPDRVVNAANMHKRDPQYDWIDNPKKELEQSIADQWERIQQRESKAAATSTVVDSFENSMKTSGARRPRNYGELSIRASMPDKKADSPKETLTTAQALQKTGQPQKKSPFAFLRNGLGM